MNHIDDPRSISGLKNFLQPQVVSTTAIQDLIFYRKPPTLGKHKTIDNQVSMVVRFFKLLKFEILWDERRENISIEQFLRII